MKRISFALLVLLCLLFTAGCDDDEFGPAVDEDGLTTDIRDLLPDSILTAIEDLGHPIYGGGSPPDVVGSYLVSPLEMKSTNIVDDNYEIGRVIDDITVDFSGQNSQDLVVDVVVEEPNATSIGEGSFIVGDGCNFSIFVEKTFTDTQGHTLQQVCVLSGCVQDDGIADFHMSLVVIDDNGDPNNQYIENGQGRTFFDSDGLSERQ